MDLHLELTSSGLRAALTDALREAVRSGRLVSGTRLPSSRSLAADLGIARNTVADAYSELVAEGWLTAQQGSGTRVAKRSEPRRVTPTAPTTSPAANSVANSAKPPTSPRPRYNLMPGSPDLAEFPRKQWLAAARRAITAAPDGAFGYGDARGQDQLRAVIADYLARVRGVYASPDRIVICSGFHHGLMLMGRALKAKRVRAVAVESYGLGLYRDVLTSAGLATPTIPVDERGANIADLARLRGVGAVLLTPAHQYPTGVPLHPDRRAAAVDWARRTDALILEDDYDGEFRYDRQPVGALQGLDPERVVYFGSVSKSLAPALRLGWMVLPHDLIPLIVAAKGHGDYMSSAIEQLTLADFIASGSYEQHVRSMRLHYRRRRDQLVTTLAQRAPGVRVTGLDAGLQAVLELPPGTERAVVQAAANHGLTISGMAEFRYDVTDSGAPTREPDALVVNFASSSDSAWAGALDALCRALS
jgi:GntR family transcriptional regulator/MocR family aminotransferase